MKYTALLLTLFLFIAGCSTQHREAEAILSDEELSQLVDEFFGGVDSNGFLSMSNASSVNIYHAGSTTGRPAKSILAIVDMSVIDPDANWQTYTWSNDTGLNAVDVVFAERITDNGESFYSLAMKFSYSDLSGITYFQATSQDPADVSFTEDSFQVVLRDSANQTFIARSDDLHPDYEGELADSVKLNLYYVDNAGTEFYIGQISTMARYALR